MTGTSTLEVYDADILVAETGMIVCSMQVIKGDVREAILHKKVNFFLSFLQYRVGAFGFFYQGSDEAPGNMGLYDQVPIIMACQQIPTWHIPARWEYVMVIGGGNVPIMHISLYMDNN